MNTKTYIRFSLLLLAFLVTIVGTAYAAETWVSDPKTGTRIGWSSVDWVITTGNWTGPAANGKAEGKGELDATLRYKDGTNIQVKGEVETLAGLLDGKAVLKFSSGDSFEGYYKLGQKSGSGIFRFASGSYYEGNWKNNDYDGKGFLKFTDGRTYEGDFVNGQPEGLGVGKDATGKVVHDGQWKAGMPVEVIKADKVLGVPWAANEADTKKILLQRPKMSGPYPFMSGKDGQNVWKGYFGPYADFADAWIYVYFYQNKMWQVRISWPLKEDQVIDRFNIVKAGLTERYGAPFVDRGKFLDNYLAWSLGGSFVADLEIRKNTTKLTSADPTPQTHPFRVIIAYYDSNVAKELGLVQSDKPGGGVHKDY